jgi:hypothetical protein
MAKVLDQSGDINFRELTRLARLYDFPDFAKQAELAEVVGPDQQQSNLFADVRVPHQFPCHTKAATYVSYAFFLEKSAEINPKVRTYIQDRLNKFAEYWSIKNAVSDLRKRYETLNKQSEYPDSAYAIVWVTEDGNKERHYPLRNAMEVKAASDWYKEYLPQIRAQFGFTDRQTIANKIVIKAAEYGADISENVELLEKHAGRGVCDPRAVAKMIRERVKAASKCTPDVATVMQKLASAVEVRPSTFLDPESMTHLADTVDRFDRTHGLLNRYTSMIPAPEDVLFSATYTKAAEVCRDSCSLITGSMYDLNDFSKLSTTDVQDLFGDEVVDAVCSGLRVDPAKMAEVAATFPRNDAVVLEQLLAERGVASTYLGFSFNQLKQMAVV